MYVANYVASYHVIICLFDINVIPLLTFRLGKSSDFQHSKYVQ